MCGRGRLKAYVTFGKQLHVLHVNVFASVVENALNTCRCVCVSVDVCERIEQVWRRVGAGSVCYFRECVRVSEIDKVSNTCERGTGAGGGRGRGGPWATVDQV